MLCLCFCSVNIFWKTFVRCFSSVCHRQQTKKSYLQNHHIFFFKFYTRRGGRLLVFLPFDAYLVQKSLKRGPFGGNHLYIGSRGGRGGVRREQKGSWIPGSQHFLSLLVTSIHESKIYFVQCALKAKKNNNVLTICKIVKKKIVIKEKG